jgi:arginase
VIVDRKVVLIGVPMDLGGGRRGVDMGPSAVRIAGLKQEIERLGVEFEDRGNIEVCQPERSGPVHPKARYLDEIADSCARLRDDVLAVLRDGGLPLVVGGDHSIACGTVAGISSFHDERKERIGLLWFDAHTDMNTPESTESGNVHGMPLAACVGLGATPLVELGSRVPMVDPRNAAIVGVRSVDRREREVVLASGVRVFTMHEIDKFGIHRVMQEALEIANDGTAGFHLSFDVDGIDPSVAPGVGTPIPAGTTLRESHLVMEHAAESGRLLGLEMTEINPILDTQNVTARVAVELALSALGKSTL